MTRTTEYNIISYDNNNNKRSLSPYLTTFQPEPYPTYCNWLGDAERLFNEALLKILDQELAG